MITGSALIGLLVGLLVGVTGIGGGLLLMPLLIFSVRWRLVARLTSGSIPGACLGVLFLTRIRGAYGEDLNYFLRVAVGALLVVVPIRYVASQNFLKAIAATWSATCPLSHHLWCAINAYARELLSAPPNLRN